LLASGTVHVPGTFDYVGTLAAFDVVTGKAVFQTELKERGASLSLSPGGKLIAVAGRNLPAAGPGAATRRAFRRYPPTRQSCVLCSPSHSAILTDAITTT